jgi:pyruvate/2-oxoglutarate dehydrogenase complex dihydrolipoamide acyltransferase (E2) component
MRQDILVPRVSETTEEGILVTWFVEPGATVREGDLVAEVQVEKISAEVRASANGRIELLAEPGGVIVQGTPIAAVETVQEPAAVGAAAAPTPVPTPVVVAAVPSAGPTVSASPAARRLARELGVDIASIAGSGPDGRIVEADVQAAAGDGRHRPELVALTPMRRAIAERLRNGLLGSAQLTLTAEADVTALAEMLAAASAGGGPRATYTAAAVRACALALREHPRLGATWTDEGLRLPARIDIGVAVALDDGLIAPVVRDAAAKSLAELDREIADLAERARSARLTEVEMQGAVFSVTNLGGHRIDAFTPLLDPPQTAILGLGRARPRPAVVDGVVVPRTLVVLSLTFDHRVVDGAPAAAFLDQVIGALEDPAQLR